MDRRCYTCKEVKPLEAFAKSAKESLGHRYECKVCQNKHAKAFHKQFPERTKQYEIKHNLMKDFGLTVETYDAMLVAQNGVCKICGNPPTTERLSVDHDHQTGKLRGLLCRHCNVGLGHFRDDPNRLINACKYLWDFMPKSNGQK